MLLFAGLSVVVDHLSSSNRLKLLPAVQRNNAQCVPRIYSFKLKRKRLVFSVDRFFLGLESDIIVISKELVKRKHHIKPTNSVTLKNMLPSSSWILTHTARRICAYMTHNTHTIIVRAYTNRLPCVLTKYTYVCMYVYKHVLSYIPPSPSSPPSDSR